MSNLGRRELGAGEKALKYEFSLEILRVRVEVPLPCKLKFMWKRNSKGIETKVPCEVLTKGSVDLGVNEKVSSISTIIYDTERKEFQGKDSELIVQMYISNSPKKLASCQVDMKSILDPLNVRTPRTRLFELPLAMSVSLPAKTDNLITFRLTSQFKEEIIPSERSLGGGTLNTSGLSIQDNKYFERRRNSLPTQTKSFPPRTATR